MRLTFAVAALWLALCATAAADVFDDSPATASRGGGDKWLFARTADGAILERHLVENRWTDWAEIGRNATSGPAAVGYGNSVLVFIRGRDGGIFQNTYTAGAWLGWSALGGYSLSGPAAAVRRGPSGYVDLAIRGGNNQLYFRSFVPGQGWSGWASRGGNLTSGAAIGSQANGLVNVFTRGTDAAVKQMGWTGSAWTDWIDIGGGIIGAPATVSRSEGFLNVYARGANNALYVRTWTSTAGWGAWTLLDQTAIDSAPAAGGSTSDQEWVVARKGANLLYKEWNSGSGWRAFQDLGPIAVPAPPAPPAPAPAPPPDGEVSLETGVRCTPPGGRLRVSITVRTPKGQARARVQRIVFYTKGKSRVVRVDRKAPFVVRIRINRPAGATGRVYARVYFKRSARGKVQRKTVSRRYTVCR